MQVGDDKKFENWYQNKKIGGKRSKVFIATRDEILWRADAI